MITARQILWRVAVVCAGLALCGFAGWLALKMASHDLNTNNQLAGVVSAYVGIGSLAASVVAALVAVRQGSGSDGKQSTTAPARRVTAWDAFQLGVHRSIVVSGRDNLPALPAYISRAHDVALRELLQTRRTQMIMLTGSSSTGKTRFAHEAVRECLRRWSLLRPADSAELINLVNGRRIPRRTVVWLNEAQIYLTGPQGPAAAGALTRLLGAARSVIVIGTLWSTYWDDLTDPSDARLQDPAGPVRELLARATRVIVPESFAAENVDDATLRRLEEVASRDDRIAEALDASGEHQQIIQVLAGGLAMVTRYEHPDAGNPNAVRGTALITAAMDARRLGQLSPLMASYLRDAVPGYLDEHHRVSSDPAWFTQALAYAVMPTKGVSALIPTRLAAGIGEAEGYLLADYMAQYAQRSREATPVPATTWTAFMGMPPTRRTALGWQMRRTGVACTATASPSPPAQLTRT